VTRQRFSAEIISRAVTFPKLCVVDAHGSERHGHTRFYSDLNLVAWLVGDALAVFKQAVNDHANDVVDALKGFVLRFAPRCRPVPFERRAVGVPTRRIAIEVLVGSTTALRV